MKAFFLSIAFALIGTTLALPANPDLPKDVDLEGFSKFAGLENVEQLEQALSAVNEDLDEDADVKSRSLEARQSAQCTLKRIKQVMFDFCTSPLMALQTSH